MFFISCCISPQRHSQGDGHATPRSPAAVDTRWCYVPTNVPNTPKERPLQPLSGFSDMKKLELPS